MRSCVNPRVDLTACKGTHGDCLRQLFIRGRIAARSGDPITKMMRTPPQSIIMKNDDGDVNGDRKRVENAITAAFSSSREVLRSPVFVDLSDTQPTAPGMMTTGKSANGAKSPRELLDYGASQSGTETPIAINALDTETAEQNTGTYSPRLEQIERMRGIEEESLRKCVAVLRKMALAIERQKNISRDVKDGLSELNEQIDVIESCRRIWKELESTRNKEAEKGARGNFQAEKILLQTDGKETPVTGRAKRIASSPAAPVSHKKIKENGQGEWQTVTNRKNRRKVETENKTPVTEGGNGRHKKRKEKKKVPKDGRKLPEAVLVKPTEGKSYSEVLRDLKNTVKPEDAEIAIRSVRKTKNGSILLELGKGGSKEKFCEAIKTSLRGTVNVSTLRPKSTIEIRDLDALTEAHEVIAALKELIGNPEEEYHTRLTKTNTREQRRAFVTLSTEAALNVIKGHRIKIGWTSCRVRIVPNMQRCFKCFGSGHTRLSCKGPDRMAEGLCIRCGRTGHKIRDCTNIPRCCICIAWGRCSGR